MAIADDLVAAVTHSKEESEQILAALKVVDGHVTELTAQNADQAAKIADIQAKLDAAVASADPATAEALKAAQDELAALKSAVADSTASLNAESDVVAAQVAARTPS